MEIQEIKKIMEETCFKSLSYCCGLEKNCPSRDNVIKKLGLKKEDFRKLKHSFDKNLFKLLEK